MAASPSGGLPRLGRRRPRGAGPRDRCAGRIPRAGRTAVAGGSGAPVGRIGCAPADPARRGQRCRESTRERMTAPSYRAYRTSGASFAAEPNTHTSASSPAGGPPRLTHGSPRGAPANHTVNFSSSTTARCLSRPPRVSARRPDSGVQAGGVQAVGLPAERRPLPVQRSEQVLELGAGHRWFPGRRHPVGHAVIIHPRRRGDVQMPCQAGLAR